MALISSKADSRFSIEDESRIGLADHESHSAIKNLQPSAQSCSAFQYREKEQPTDLIPHDQTCLLRRESILTSLVPMVL